MYLGTMTFAWSQTSSRVDEPIAMEMLERFMAHNERFGDEDCHRIDTARIYAGGKTEPMVGAVVRRILTADKNKDSSSKIFIGTKAHPSQTGGLSAQGLQTQFQDSLDKMAVSAVDEYYLHQPDTEHSLLESLQTCHDMVSKGMVSRIGMSNYHASEMKRAFELCQQHNLTPPTVYQGLYNPLNRLVEEELLPLLKKHKCSFVAYNPLAAGLLTGKHTDPGEAMKGRFKDNQNYLPRFYTPANFAAIHLIHQACDKEGISMVEATYRWLLRHSALGDNDGVLLGASSLAQLNENLSACAAAKEKGPLSEGILKAFDEGWKLTKEGAFPYWRSYSADMPDRESLDQGASYDAAKK